MSKYDDTFRLPEFQRVLCPATRKYFNLDMPPNISAIPSFTDLVAARSMEPFKRILDDPECEYSGFDLSVTQTPRGVHMSGKLHERMFEVECPHCADLHSVPMVPGKYHLSCQTYTVHQWTDRGKPFTAIVKCKRGDLHVFVRNQ